MHRYSTVVIEIAVRALLIRQRAFDSSVGPFMNSLTDNATRDVRSRAGSGQT